MPDTKSYIVNGHPTETDALDFTPYIESLMDVCKTANITCTIGIFGKRKI